MASNILLKVREEHYLKLKQLLKKHNLTMFEFMDIITTYILESKMFLRYLMIKNQKVLNENEFFSPDVDLEVKYPTNAFSPSKRHLASARETRG